jgi:rRNA-processing protein FCF1
MVVMDSTIALLLFYPNAKPPIDPATGEPLQEARARVDLLLKGLSAGKVRVGIPTPVLSEILVAAGAAKAKIISVVTKSSAFQILPFETNAAVEVAMLSDPDLLTGKPLSLDETKAKVKYDRQILAIAKTSGAHTIFTDDGNLRKRALAEGLKVISTWELPLPEKPPQTEISFPAHASGPFEVTGAEALVRKDR